jgi:hypothetical protein
VGAEDEDEDTADADADAMDENSDDDVIGAFSVDDNVGNDDALVLSDDDHAWLT